MQALPDEGRVLGFSRICCHRLHVLLPTDHRELPALQGLREERCPSRDQAPGDINNAPLPRLCLAAWLQVLGQCPQGGPGTPWHPAGCPRCFSRDRALRGRGCKDARAPRRI